MEEYSQMSRFQSPIIAFDEIDDVRNGGKGENPIGKWDWELNKPLEDFFVMKKGTDENIFFLISELI